MSVVDDELRKAVAEDRAHWSMTPEARRRPVFVGNRGLKPEWVKQRHNLQFERPTYPGKWDDMLDHDIVDNDALEDGDEADGALPMASPAFFSESWEDIQKSAAAMAVLAKARSHQMTIERIAKELGGLGKCICNRTEAGEHRDTCPAHYMNHA